MTITDAPVASARDDGVTPLRVVRTVDSASSTESVVAMVDVTLTDAGTTVNEICSAVTCSPRRVARPVLYDAASNVWTVAAIVASKVIVAAYA